MCIYIIYISVLIHWRKSMKQWCCLYQLWYICLLLLKLPFLPIYMCFYSFYVIFRTVHMTATILGIICVDRTLIKGLLQIDPGLCMESEKVKTRWPTHIMILLTVQLFGINLWKPFYMTRWACTCSGGIMYHVRAGVCRPCVETKPTATAKSATDSDRSVTTLLTTAYN